MKNTWRFNGNEERYLLEVISGDMISSTSGNMNQRFEAAFASAMNTKYAVTFNSGTSTLHAALHACDVHAGDEVIIPPLTVISNADVVFAQGAIPVFADVDPNTWCMDPASAESLITPKTKAIMPVALYGLSPDLQKFESISKKYDIPIINDAAEAFGARCNGNDMNSMADITSYSLENSKHITTGDGGIVVTNDEELAVKMRKFGSLSYGAMKAGDGRIRLNKSVFQNPNYSRHDDVGLNYRMPEVAAALGLAQTERIDYFINKRIDNAKILSEAVADCDWLVEQVIPNNYRHTQWTYVVKMIRDDIDWFTFKQRFEEFGGDGPFGCWKITYLEDLFTSKAYKRLYPDLYGKVDYAQGICPISEEIQPKLLQFPTNQGTLDEVNIQRDALLNTIKSFD
jgi:perosamine synthetase